MEIHGKRIAYDSNSMDCYFLQPDEDVPKGSEIAPVFEHCGVLRQPPYIVVNVTHKCNLACEYCFVQNYEEDLLGNMNFQTAVAGIERFQNENCRFVPIRVGFFGGEPTLNMPLVRQIIAYVKRDANLKLDFIKKNPPANFDLERTRNQLTPRFHMTTNGVLAGEQDEISDLLINEKFSLIVSIDGPEHIHNSSRPARNPNVNSYQSTMRFLRKLIGTETARMTTLRATFSESNLNILERVKHLNDLMWSGCGSHVSVEPLSISESNCVTKISGLEFHEGIIKKMESEYWKVAEWFVDSIKQGRYPRLHHFNTPIKRLYTHLFSPSECGAGKGGYYTIEPNGDICACHRTANTKIGDIIDGVDESLRAKWIDNRLYMRTGCNECKWRWVCGGGCRSDSLDCGLPITTPVPIDCAIKDIWYRCAIWIISELSDDEIRRVAGVRDCKDKSCA